MVRNDRRKQKQMVKNDRRKQRPMLRNDRRKPRHMVKKGYSNKRWRLNKRQEMRKILKWLSNDVLRTRKNTRDHTPRKRISFFGRLLETISLSRGR